MKNNLLDFALKTIEAVPQVIRYLSPAYKSQEYFLTQITGLVRGVYGGFIGGDFIDTMANLISGQLWDAYQSAWFDEGGSGELPEYLQASYQATVANQYAFVDGFYRDIIDARIDKTPITPLLARADMWASQWDVSYKEAITLIRLKNGGNLEWKKGQTEKGCRTCASLDGIVMSAREWEALELHPRGYPNSKLECEGGGPVNNCDCELFPTDKRRSPNAYGRVEEILLAKKSIKGGEGSGNFGHDGRPGLVGGSSVSRDNGKVATVEQAIDIIKNKSYGARAEQVYNELVDNGIDYVYAYHISNVNNIESISENGINVSSQTDRPDATYFFLDKSDVFSNKDILGYTEDSVVLTIRIPAKEASTITEDGLFNGTFSSSYSAARLFQKIPASWIVKKEGL